MSGLEMAFWGALVSIICGLVGLLGYGLMIAGIAAKARLQGRNVREAVAPILKEW
jgi:hypothetical protein